MTHPKILAVLAHPDDETLGFGGTLARYAALGSETHLICATRGQRGWFGAPDDYPGPDALGAIREGELRDAAQILNLRSIQLLNYMDGELDQVDPQTIIHELAEHIRRIRPQIVLTFDPYGVYGHPDHIAIAQFTTAAIVEAAGGTHPNDAPPYRVEALYYRVLTAAELVAYQSAFGQLVMTIDGADRQATPWPDWAVSTRIDTCAYVAQVWQAVRAHYSQLSGYERLMALPPHEQQAIFGSQTFYRAFSFTAAGRRPETELSFDTNSLLSPQRDSITSGKYSS
ncbi:MAG: PIG-L family deacetylase [Anaerolineae bacterium]|nr:PIG-L family deacetylase [Anaerolineae bacterium]